MNAFFFDRDKGDRDFDCLVPELDTFELLYFLIFFGRLSFLALFGLFPFDVKVCLFA